MNEYVYFWLFTGNIFIYIFVLEVLLYVDATFSIENNHPVNHFGRYVAITRSTDQFQIHYLNLRFWRCSSSY